MTFSLEKLGITKSPLEELGQCRKFHHRGTENTERTRRKKILYFPPFFSSAILCVSAVVFIFRFTAPELGMAEFPLVKGVRGIFECQKPELLP